MANKTLDEIQVLMVEWTNTITGLVTILDKQNLGQPATPYVVLKTLADVTPVSYDIETTRIENGQMISGMRGMCRLEFQWIAYDGDPSASLNRLRNSFWSTYFSDWKAENELELGLSQMNPIRDISDVFTNERVQPRSEFVMSFYTSIGDEYNIDCYDSTTVEVIPDSREDDKIVITVDAAEE